MATTGNNQAALGWISGLGLAVAPWLVAGVISTFLPDPESMFPPTFVAAFVGMVAWIIFGSIRLPGFRRGALIGSAISAGLTGALYIAVLIAQP